MKEFNGLEWFGLTIISLLVIISSMLAGNIDSNESVFFFYLALILQGLLIYTLHERE